MKYRKYVSNYVIKPYGHTIYSEDATYIGLKDEGKGLFVSVKQENGNSLNKISINRDEWPLIKEAVKSLLLVIEAIEVIEPANTPENNQENDLAAS